MSVSVAKADGVTVFTLTSDPQSLCPPFCQILCSRSCSSNGCSVSPHLRKVQGASQSILGTLHIMVGALTIGLGVPLTRDEAHYFWLGAMFLLFGIICILSEKYPSPGLVILNVILNLAGVGFAIAAIVLHSISVAIPWQWWSYYDDDYDSPLDTSPLGITSDRRVVLVMRTCILAVLIVLSVLELCVTISSAVMGIKALRSTEKKENKSTDDPEDYKPLLSEVTSNPIV